MRDSEEHHEWGTGKSWLFILGLSALLFSFMELLMMIPEVPRTWDHGTVPFTPSESIYSTNNPDNDSLQKMVEPLPGRDNSSMIYPADSTHLNTGQ
jgi:hypothetical protein